MPRSRFSQTWTLAVYALNTASTTEMILAIQDRKQTSGKGHGRARKESRYRGVGFRHGLLRGDKARRGRRRLLPPDDGDPACPRPRRYPGARRGRLQDL